jgi:DNA-binding protein HU-beta
MLPVTTPFDRMPRASADVARIGALRAGCRLNNIFMEIIMPPAKKVAPAPAKKGAASVKPVIAGEAIAKKPAPVSKVTAVSAKKVAVPLKAATSKKRPPITKPVAPAVKNAAPTAKKAAVAKAAPQVTVTLKQFAAELAESHDLAKKVAEAVLGDFVALTSQHLAKGDKIRLTGLGILQVRARPARTARNPATGETIEVAASRKIAFRPSKELKEAV